MPSKVQFSEVSINAHFDLFIERVGISGGSLVMKINENCFIFYRVTKGPFTLAKTKIQKTWVFCCTVYTARKTHNIRGFWHEKRMREKTRISYMYLCFGKWCACATSLYLWPYTCSAHYVAGSGRVIPLKVTYHVTKNPNNTSEIGASVYIGKKPVKFRRRFKKSRCGGGFFDSGFLECLGEVA